jgi:uncharacterized protein YjbI with pentapeptide repeats
VLGGVDALIEEVSQDIANEYGRVANTEEIRQVRIDNLAKTEELVNEYLEQLSGETLPELNARLTVAEAEIDTLENVTIPALNGRLNSTESELTVITDTTIPQVQSELDIAQGQIANIQGEIFSVTGSVPQTIDDVLETISQDTAEIFQEIYASRIGANSVTALAIKANAVTADKIVANAITADKIAANAITADKIQANAIDGRTITGLTINGAVINAGTLNAINIVGTSTISGANIIGNSISGGTISGASMTAGTITGAEINAGTIKAGTSIEGAFIGGTEIIGGDISGTNISGSTITGGFIFGTEIEGVDITGTSRIFSPEIIGGDISGTNITATNTITGATINGAEINTGTLTGNTINGGTINSVTANSLELNASTINGGIINAPTINAGTVTGSLVRTAASGSRVEVQDDGTYLVWGGDGTKNDGNAAFFVKKNGSAKFAGDISGSSGTFNGTVSAQNIIGDVYNVKRVSAPAGNKWFTETRTTITSYLKVASLNIPASAFNVSLKATNLYLGFGALTLPSGSGGLGRVQARLPSGTVLRTWNIAFGVGGNLPQAGYIESFGAFSLRVVSGMEIPAGETRVDFFIEVFSVTGTPTFEIYSGINTTAAALEFHDYVEIETAIVGGSFGASITA